jgi:hypothetical protein
MKNYELCSSIPLSKELAKLLPKDTADMAWRPIQTILDQSEDVMQVYLHYCGFLSYDEYEPYVLSEPLDATNSTTDVIPAWSLSRLFKLISNHLTRDYVTYDLRIMALSNGDYSISYYNYNYGSLIEFRDSDIYELIHRVLVYICNTTILKK